MESSLKDASKSAGSPLVYLIAIALSVLFHLIGGKELCAGENSSSAYKDTSKINILANKLVFEREKNFAEFSGNVKATEKDTVLTSETMKIYFSDTLEKGQEKTVNSRNIKEIQASGNVKITFEDTVAISEKAVYSIQDNVLILTGKNTRLTRAGNSITGDKITIFRSDGRVSVEGSSQNRVQAEFMPQNGSEVKELKTEKQR